MDARHRESARTLRSQLSSRQRSPNDDRGHSPTLFRTALASVSPADRDAWLDLVLGRSEIEPDDRASLPPGCVPYLPSPIDKLIEVAEHANVQSSDVFVDIGSGAGRATIAMHLMTGAEAIGLEIQPHLAMAARDLCAHVGAERVAVIEGDATLTTGLLRTGSVFFLYCPFSGERLTKVLADLEAIAQTRPIRVCCLDLPLPECPWLDLASQPSAGLDIYRSR